MDKKTASFGGYNNDIFLNLSKRERLEYSCCICRFVLNQPHQCENGDQYCSSCIKEWKRRGNMNCPVCGQTASLHENNEIENKLGSKYVRCEAEHCPWKGRLERLDHHVAESHGTSTESRAGSTWDGLSVDERFSPSKLAHEVNKSYSLKRNMIIRRIRKMEKRKTMSHGGRVSTQTVVPESVSSRVEGYRPFSDIVTLNSSEKFPQVKWSTIEVDKDSFYGRIDSMENVKHNRREITHRKLEHLERRKLNEMNTLFKKIEDLDRRRKENREITENRIIQIERKMKEEREAFERKIHEKERRQRIGQESVHRRVSVVHFKMKK